MVDEQQVKILIVEDEEEIRELVSIIVGGKIAAHFFEAKSGKDAIEILSREEGKIDLVICDFNMPNGNGAVVFNFIKENMAQVPYILMTSDVKEDHLELTTGPLCGYIQKPFFDDSIFDEIERLLRLAKKSAPKQPEYVSVTLKTLEHIESLEAPIFIRLADGHFVKVLNAGDIFSHEESDRFAKKGAFHLYVEQVNLEKLIQKFKNRVMNEMFISILEKKDLRMVQLTKSVQEIVSHAVRTLNWSEDIQQMAQKNISLVQATVEHFPNLCDAYNWFENDEHEYGVLHSVLLAYSLTWICKDIQFQSKNALQYLTLAAFFHDASIEDHFIKNEGRFIGGIHLKTATNKDEIEIVRRHPGKSVELLGPWKTAPLEVLEIIRQHHELPDGSGFPLALKGNQMGELTGAFIVAHEMVEIFLKTKDRGAVKSEMAKQAGLLGLEPSGKFYNSAMRLL